MRLGRFGSIWVALGTAWKRWRDPKLNTLQGMGWFECVWVDLGRLGYGLEEVEGPQIEYFTRYRSVWVRLGRFGSIWFDRVGGSCSPNSKHTNL